MTGGGNAVELDGIGFAYPGSGSGVSGVSLSVAPGEIYGLLGVNGAGKTTLMRIMIGLLSPDAGTVRYFGRDLASCGRDAMAMIGSLIETPSLYGHLTAREHLRIFAHYTKASPSAVAPVLEIAGIADAADRLVRQFSLGMKQRLALATALLHDPPILILDEPTNGLDPAGIAAMRELVRRLAADRGKAVIISSHLLAEIEKTAARIGIIHEGTLRFDGTAEALSGIIGAASGVTLRVSAPDKALVPLGAAGLHCRIEEGKIRMEPADDAAAAAIVRILSNSGIDIYEVTREAGSLEDDFLRLTEGGADAV